MNHITNQQLKDALVFLESIDALKNTYRQCLIMSGHREESTAEHSFSLAMAVICLSPFSNQSIDVNKAIKMALYHDLAEAILGDTFHYQKSEPSESQISEGEALKSLLEPLKNTHLADEIYNLWEEFEHSQSAEAIFLRGVDRFLPMFHNFKTNGHSWVKHGITRSMALAKNSHIENSSALLWEFTQKMLEESEANGWIK